MTEGKREVGTAAMGDAVLDMFLKLSE